MSETSSKNKRGWLVALVQVVVSLAVLAGAGFVVWVIYATEPEAQREGATRKSAALVETARVQRGDFTPQLKALGHVEAADDIALSPRVDGRIISIHPRFVPGGVVDAGQPLVTLDDADFQNALRRMKSDLMQVEAELAIERGRQDVARQEFALLGQEISEDNRALVLREPQIDSIKARIASAQAAVDQAQLDLDRTRITSPFDAQIITRHVNVGSQVTSNTTLARLVGTEVYWVMATVPLGQLRWLDFPDNGEPGSDVTLRMPNVWGPDAKRTGQLLRRIGNVDEQTRLARVLIEVRDPLGRESDAPSLVLGTLLDVLIDTRPLSGVVRVDRNLLRSDDAVWVMTQDDTLDIRKPTIVFKDANYAYVNDGLSDGAKVVTTNLASVTQGLRLREAAPQNATAKAGNP